jgi:Mg/Co/Ni transporter MgtE
VVDDAGRLIGTVTTAEVVELIEQHAEANRASRSPAGAGT